MTAAAAVVAKELGVAKESVRRWAIQSQVYGGQRPGSSSEELAAIKALKVKVRRPEEDNAILESATAFVAIQALPRIRRSAPIQR